MSGTTRGGTATLIVVPTLNENGTIEEVINGARTVGDVLVVDDGSDDGTLDTVATLQRDDEHIFLLNRSKKMGLASAYVDGFGWGLKRRYQRFGKMDADMSHNPDDLPRLVKAMDTGADLVIGSRYVPGGGSDGWPWYRQLISKGGNFYVWFWTGTDINDATAGFRLYHRHVLETIGLDTIVSEGYAFQVEMALRAQAHGYTVTEVPIVFTERVVGVSKMNSAIVKEAVWRVPAWGLGKLGRFHRR